MLRLLWTVLVRALAFLPLLLVRGWRRLRLGSEAVVGVRVGRARSDGAGSLSSSRELVEGLLELARDPRVKALVVDLRGVSGGWATVQEIRRALARVRKAGKLVVTHVDGLDLRDLYLASVADRVWLTPTATVFVSPVGSRLQFVGDALALFGLRVEVESAGDYKSFGERFTRSYPTRENREQLTTVLTDLQQQVVAGIARARGVEPAAVEALVGAGPLDPEAAVAAGLVDGLAYPDQARAALRELLGGRKRAVGFGRWLRLFQAERWLSSLGREEPGLAVVHLEGPIVMGAEAQGGAGHRIDADRVVPVLDRLRKDDSVRGVVLFVDSPGGSALASDLIARSVRRVADHKPVIAAFHDVSASGGYYLSAPASEIIAREGTITGSIGGVGGKVVRGPALERWGVRGETVAAGPGADFFGPWRGFTRTEREQYRAMLMRTYERFLTVVAGGRRRPVAAIEPVAGGRIWTGRQAQEHGLVDHLGGLDRALERARALSGVEPDRGRVRHIRFPPPRYQVLQALLSRGVARFDLLSLLPGGTASTLVRLLRASPGAPLALLPWDIDGGTSRPS